MNVQSSEHRIQVFLDADPKLTPEILLSQEQNYLSYYSEFLRKTIPKS